MKTKKASLTPFGCMVKKRLIDKNMTQVELADLLGCNKQYIYKILVGERSGEKYILEMSRILSMRKTEANKILLNVDLRGLEIVSRD